MADRIRRDELVEVLKRFEASLPPIVGEPLLAPVLQARAQVLQAVREGTMVLLSRGILQLVIEELEGIGDG